MESGDAHKAAQLYEYLRKDEVFLGKSVLSLKFDEILSFDPNSVFRTSLSNYLLLAIMLKIISEIANPAGLHGGW